MQTIKFISNDPNQKIFGITLRKNVNTYFKEKGISTKGNITMYIKAIILLSIYIAPLIVLLTVNVNLWIEFLLVILMGIGEAGIGMSVMHDAAHEAFSNKKWINKLFASTMFILGSNTFNWKIQHNILHHTFTNIFGFDQDIETKAVIRLCKHAQKKRCTSINIFMHFSFMGL